MLTNEQKIRRLENKRRYVKNHRTELNEYHRRWKLKNKIKHNAHQAVQTAIMNGDLKKSKKCEDCGLIKKMIHGHHEDYSKPLEVRWLCVKCHRKAHGNIPKCERKVHFGSANKSAKLNENQVLEIRKLLKMGKGKTAIARRYGVVDSLIHQIAKRQIWTHV